MSFGFRVARHGSAVRNVAKTLFQSAFLWWLALYAIPVRIVAFEDALGWSRVRFPLQTEISLAGLAVASLLGQWSGWTMAILGDGTPLPLDTARRLVIRGPYAYVRNPMAVAGLAQGFFVAVFWGSGLTLAYVAFGMALWNWVARPLEESDLIERFGDAYRRYRREVPLWLPRLTPYRSSS